MTAWTVSHSKAGTVTQCLGVAKHFDADPRSFRLAGRLSKWALGPFSPYWRLDGPKPNIIISCGSIAPKHVMAMIRACRHEPLLVHLQPLEDEYAARYDLVFAGRHNLWKISEPPSNYRAMIGAPHQITLEKLSALRAAAREKWSVEAEQRVVTVLIGGPTRAYAFSRETVGHLIETLCNFARSGWKVLATASRRSPSELREQLQRIHHPGVIFWNGKDQNPYLEFLAAADAFLVTKDTVTMTCEALASGKPIHVFELPKLSGAKLEEFEWFHRDLRETLGLTRSFTGDLTDYVYAPLDEAGRIAKEVRAFAAESGQWELTEAAQPNQT